MSAEFKLHLYEIKTKYKNQLELVLTVYSGLSFHLA